MGWVGRLPKDAIAFSVERIRLHSFWQKYEDLAKLKKKRSFSENDRLAVIIYAAMNIAICI
jgi:hypothetical protein